MAVKQVRLRSQITPKTVLSGMLSIVPSLYNPDTAVEKGFEASERCLGHLR